MTRRWVLAAGVAAFAAQALAAPSSRLIPGPWQRFGSTSDPDYTAWSAFLDRYLDTSSADSVHRIRYAQAAQEKVDLAGIVQAMAEVDTTVLSKPAAMAYWINLYNALTIQLVVEAFPVTSIKQVQGGLFNVGPWDEKAVTVAGERLSLDDIEHGILRPIWQDPLFHYGINCASIGCPNLSAKPFRSSDLDAQLDAAARAFIAHPRGVSAGSDGLTLSSIYDWFDVDFGGTEAAVLKHLSQYAERPLSGPIAGYEYDWSLNAA